MLSSVCCFLEGKTSGTMYKLFPEENASLNVCKNLNAGVHLEVWLLCIFNLMLCLFYVQGIKLHSRGAWYNIIRCV